jgi:multidrug transporter EmrE-like cation transporter
MVGWIAGLGWAWCLRRLPLGLAIPLYAGLAYVLSLVSAVYILKEKMSAGQIVGIAVILTGVLLVTLSSSSASGAYSRQ